jgi:hypothetical protein
LVFATFTVITLIQTGGGRKLLTKIRRRNFKSIRWDPLEEALNIHDWAGIYSLKDVDEVHKYIVRGIVAALNVVAPIKEIVVKTGSNLYLTEETLEMIKRRDTAKVGSPRLASESVDLAMDLTIPMVETVNLASDAASLATEAADIAGDESTKAPT